MHGSSVNNYLTCTILYREMQQHIFGCVFNHSHFGVRKEILCPCPFLERLKPTEVRLVVAIHTRHQLDVRTVLVSKISVPRPTKISVAPSPLLFTRRDVMVGNMKKTSLYIFFVTAYKIVF